MPPPSLKIAEGLSLPLSVVTERSAFIGRTGQGKTYAAQKLAELLHAAKAQFVVLDPVGVWWGLRLAADGRSPGLDIPVLGGRHGDVPLEPGAGKLVADLAVDRGLSMVIDVSDFEHDTDLQKFAADFGARFFYRKKSSPSAVLVFLEEMQEFVPQNPGPRETTMLHVYTRMAKIGRNYGIGICGITQRPQEVNKKVLNLTELLFAFQLNGAHEREAVQRWIADKSIREDIESELPKLKPWHPHAWSPSWLGISKVVRVEEKWTYDASSTPKAGTKAGDFRPLGPIDLEKLRATMAETIERARQEDPRELRARISKLESDLRAAMIASQRAQVVPEIVKVSVVKDAQIARLEKAIDKMDAVRDRLAQAQQVVVTESATIRHQIAKVTQPAPVETPRSPIPNLRQSGSAPLTKNVEIRRAVDAAKDVRISGIPRLGSGERAVLIAIAQQPDGAEKDQISILTGYKRSSRDTYIQRLRAKGAVCDHIAGRVAATPYGIALLGDDYEPLPTGGQLRRYWLERLPVGEQKILESVLAAYPKAIHRDDIGTDYRRSSRDTYLQRLGARKLVVSEGPGFVKASPSLFG